MTDRLRIAYIVHDYHRRGGHSRYVAELVSRFRKDHQIDIYTNRFEDPNPEGLNVIRIPAIRTNALSTILSFFLPATFLFRGPYDIVHSQGFCGWQQNITTCHFIQGAWYDHLRRAQGGRLTWKQQLFRFLVSGLERTAFRSTTRKVIAISNLIQKDLATYFHRRRGVEVIYHGVDLETFHPRNQSVWRQSIRTKLGLDNRVPLALFVGNPDKGAAAAIQSVAKFSKLHLAIVSAGNYQRYRDIASQLQSQDRIHFCGPTAQVETYFAAADFFLFPTVYEPFGMVITEAMASGLPVITSATAGAAELITHRVEGLITSEAWNIDQISESIAFLLQDPDRMQIMGQAARQRIEAYTWDRVAEQTMKLYQEIVASDRSHS